MSTHKRPRNVKNDYDLQADEIEQSASAWRKKRAGRPAQATKKPVYSLTDKRVKATLLALQLAEKALQGADCHAAIAEEMEYWLQRTGVGQGGRKPIYATHYIVTLPDGSAAIASTRAQAAEIMGVKPATLSTSLSRGNGQYKKRALTDAGDPSYMSCRAVTESGEESANDEPPSGSVGSVTKSPSDAV